MKILGHIGSATRSPPPWPKRDPTNPGFAAVILGITDAVVNEHYRKARQADAARKLQANLRAERERTRATAERTFGLRSR